MENALREFYIEDWLERFRNLSKYNYGESGASHKSVEYVLKNSGLTRQRLLEKFLKINLNDSPNWGRDDLRKKVSSFHRGAKIENVLITTGTSEALFLLFRALKPKKVALITPAFQLLYEVPLSLGASIIPLKLSWDKNGQPKTHYEDWMRTIKEKKPDTVIINNPHNPSGILIKKTFLDELTKLTSKSGIRLVGDEHYRFLSSPKGFLGPTLYKNNKNTFITGSFIKCIGTPGLRIGWCLGNTDTLKTMQNEKNYTTHTVSPITEWISYEILKSNNSKLFTFMKEEWNSNRVALKKFLSSSNFFIGSSPTAGLVTTIGLKEKCSQKTYQDLLKHLLKNGIFLLPMNSMEIKKYSYNSSPIEKGLSFRLGLGLKKDNFLKGLIELERKTSDFFNRKC